MARKKLTKSSTDKILTGVLGGIAEHFEIDSALVRIIFLILVWSGAPVLAYIVLAVVIPEDTSKKYGKDYGYYQTDEKRKDARKVESDEDWSDF